MIRRARHRQEGLTLIEVMVAILLLSGGLLGTMKVFDSGQRASLGTSRNQKAHAIAESYLERLINVRTAAQWSALALSSAPVGETDDGAGNPNTPAAYLYAAGSQCAAAATCTQLKIVSNPNDRTSATPANVTSPETLSVDATNGTVSPKFTLPDGSGTVYQFVTTASDQTITVNGTTFYGKRVVVAVKLNGDNSKAVTKPVWVSTIVTDPTVTSP